MSAHIEDPALRSFLLQSLNISERRWRLNLPVLSASMDQIIGFPELSGRFNAPTLFLTGAQSDYLLPEHRPLIKALFPKARLQKFRKQVIGYTQKSRVNLKPQFAYF